MERREKRRGRWNYTEWKATAVLIGGHLNKRPKKQVLHEDAEYRQYLWTDFVIELLKDGAESYWSNLVAAKPSLFVVCRTNEESKEVEPFLVTANYDDIIGYLAVDDQVFSVSFPPEIYHWLEQYIVNNYVPPERRKRKRTDWIQDNHEQTHPPTRRH